MQYPKLTKKLRSNQTQEEELALGKILKSSKPGLDLVAEYLGKVVWDLDKKLSNTTSLYESVGDPHLKVATYLAKREAYMKLRSLILDEINLDVDNAGD